MGSLRTATMKGASIGYSTSLTAQERHDRRDAQIPTRASLPVPLGSSACFKSLLLECCQILFCISMLWTSTSCKFYTSSQRSPSYLYSSYIEVEP
ncbi:hypothetical protein RB195_004568 [Necator americanus]|uniref:Uncharacterized protein n=1 Tax=Necator americanus TaxID=51031 RepID=A0ABR1BN37_NECAM